MRARSTIIYRALVALAMSSHLVLTSCGKEDDGLGKRYPVRGSVQYNGQPLAKGIISFVPESPTGAGATGAIEDGSYTLETGGNSDGAQAGKYKVTITAKEDFQAKAKATFEKASGRSNSDFVPQQFLTKAASEAKSLIPTGYGDTRTTNLTAEVKPESNTIDFKISDAEAPPEPKPAAAGRGRRR
jgi:major membrane immunogen (membrane-anchored lipoprotein)